jgi:prepilin peptidase CpaA
MSGPIEFHVIVIVLVSIMGAATDIIRGRIYNLLTAPVLASGLVYALYSGGGLQFSQSFLAVVIGFLALSWMFALKFMGGGDVKFLMALAAWGGVQFVLQTTFLSLILGGIMAVFVLLSKKRFADFYSRIYVFFLSFFVKGMEKGALSIDAKSKMPFGVPIAAAAIWTIVDYPLRKWGLWPW